MSGQFQKRKLAGSILKFGNCSLNPWNSLSVGPIHFPRTSMSPCLTCSSPTLCLQASHSSPPLYLLLKQACCLPVLDAVVSHNIPIILSLGINHSAITSNLFMLALVESDTLLIQLLYLAAGTLALFHISKISSVIILARLCVFSCS